MTVREKTAVGVMGLSGLFAIAASILGLFVHVWSVVIAVASAGLLAGVVTLIFPVLSTLYWFLQVWSGAGIDHPFCVAVLSCVGLILLMLVGFVTAQGVAASN